MKALRYRATAEADLRRVAREPRAAWGADQAATYTYQLREHIKSLREFPLRFPVFESRPAMRRMNSGRHGVFYLMLDDAVEIIRVLHAASDMERWL